MLYRVETENSYLYVCYVSEKTKKKKKIYFNSLLSTIYHLGDLIIENSF